MLNRLQTLYSHPYNRQHPIAALGRVARWHFHRRLRPDAPRIYPFWGRQIKCWPDSQASRWLVMNYMLEWEEFDLIKRYLRPADVALDVGANIGLYTLWLSQFANDVHAIEPDPANYERLCENVGLNALNQTFGMTTSGLRVKTVRLALSDQRGMLRFTAGKDMENRLSEAGEQSVPASTLDDYCRTFGIHRIAYLKVDIEGAEFMMLKGAREMLARQAIGILQIELIDKQLRVFGSSCAEVVSLLESHGYKIHQFDHHRLHPIKLGEHKQNVFAVADISAANARLRM